MLLDQADERIVLAPAYAEGCMLARNIFMVEHSSACIAYWSGAQMGGTAYTVRYAQRCGSRVYNIFNRI